MKRYTITPSAQRDVNGVLSYLIDEAGIPVARRYKLAFTETFRRLGEYPRLGHPRRDLTKLDLLFFPLRPYLIVYAVEENGVLIHGVFHGARDGKSFLKDRPR